VLIASESVSGVGAVAGSISTSLAKFLVAAGISEDAGVGITSEGCSLPLVEVKLAVVRLVSAGAPSSSAVVIPSEEAVFGTALECATVIPRPNAVPHAKVVLGACTLGVAVVESRLADQSASSAKVVRVGQILGWPGSSLPEVLRVGAAKRFERGGP
jgi:hypothetical protein